MEILQPQKPISNYSEKPPLTLSEYYFEIFAVQSNFFSRYPIISEDEGLPPPSAFQSLIPTMSSFYFPECFEVFARILRVHKDIEEAAFEVEFNDIVWWNFLLKLIQFHRIICVKVKKI